MSSQPPILPTSTGDDISSKALHLKLEFHKLGNSRKVKTSQISVNGETEDNKTDKSLVRVSKKLLDSPELKAIGSADSELKSYLQLMVLPFDTGVRLVPFKAVEEVTKKLRIHARKRELLVDAFIGVYQQEIERARTRLGPLFSELDYPSTETVKAEFSFAYQFINYGAPTELQRINPDIFEEEREKAAVALREATEEIKAMMRATVAGLVEKLTEALTPAEGGKKKKLYDTTVTNLQDWLKTFDLRNVTDDRELARIVQRAKDVISGVDMERIRNSETFKMSVRQDMEEVGKLLKPLVTSNVRKLRLSEELQ